MKTVLLPILATLVLALACGGTTKADSLQVGDVLFTGTVTSTTATLTIECLDATCSGWFLSDVALKGFSYTGTPTNMMKPSGYSDPKAGGMNLGGTGNCDGKDKAGAICWSAALPLTLTLGLDVMNTFEAGISNGVAGDLHFQVLAFDISNPPATGNGGDRTIALSCDFNGSGCGTSLVQTPEPSSVLMLGAGLLAFALLAGRRVLTA